MHSTFEPTVHDELAQAQYEEMLKARVLSEFRLAYYFTTCLTHSADQAKTVYSSEDQCQTCKFEVVISYSDTEGAHNRDSIIASLVMDPFECGHGTDQFPALVVLLESEVTSNVQRAYESLVHAPRVKMTKALG